jgi:hypothetical protein
LYHDDDYDDDCRGPFRDYVVLSSVVFMGRFMGVASLHYIDFTTRVLFQSSKLIPTMLVGLLYLKKCVATQPDFTPHLS